MRTYHKLLTLSTGCFGELLRLPTSRESGIAAGIDQTCYMVKSLLAKALGLLGRDSIASQIVYDPVQLIVQFAKEVCAHAVLQRFWKDNRQLDHSLGSADGESISMLYCIAYQRKVLHNRLQIFVWIAVD